MKEHNFDFGSELGKMRTRTGLTQAALAKLAGVSEVTIRNWESSISNPKAERLKKLLEVFLLKDAFTKGKELEEAKNFWIQVRENEVRMKSAFDEEWFEELVRNQRSLRVDGEKVIIPARLEVAVEKQEAVSDIIQIGILSVRSPKDTTILPLPPAVSGLIGREKEQEWLKSSILADKVVEVSGMGGIGKTALVADTINLVQDQFRGGIAVVQANEITNPIDVVLQLIGKFVPHQPELFNRPGIKSSTLYYLLKDILILARENGGQVLIVLDNVEPGLIESEGLRQLCDIFRSTKVSAIMTTRPPVSGEIAHDGRELKQFTNEAATELLNRLLEYSLKRFLTELEKRDVAEICKIVGEHAQALVLIAAYFEGNDFESTTGYLQSLKDRPQIVLDLTKRLQDVKTPIGVRITFASSYSKLAIPVQQLFMTLGTPAGKSCTFWAIVTLGATLNQTENEIRANLATLRRSSLTLKAEFDVRGNARIELHPLVQEFARELLRTSSEISQERLHEALIRHYLEWVQKVDEELLDADDANITGILKWASSHPSQEMKVILTKLIYHLRWYWYSRFRFKESFEWLKVGCSTMELLGVDWDEMRGELLFAMGTQYQQTGEVLSAEHHYQKSFEIFDEISKKVGLKTGLGEALSGLAALEQQKGDHDKAQEDYEKSLAIFREVHDQRGEANALFRLGFLALRTGDTDAAQRYYIDSLDTYRKLRDRWGEGIGVYSLGDVCQQIGEVDKARAYYEEGLIICKEVHNRRGEGAVLKSLGDLVLQITGPAEAEKHLSKSLTIFGEIIDPQGQGVALYSMAFLLRQAGRIEDAKYLYKRSLEIRERVNDERGRGFVLKGLGDLTRRTALHAKDMSIAKTQLEEAYNTSKKVKDRRNQGVALKALGDWHWQSGHMDAARESYEKSLIIRREFHELRGEAITLKSLGDLALAQRERDYVTAQRHLEHSYRHFLKLKDLRGQGVTRHSQGILAWEQNDKTHARDYFEESLDWLVKVQDRQSEGILKYTLALWADAQKNLNDAEKWYHESLQIATEVQAANSIVLSREGLADFLARRYGQQGKRESDSLFVEAAEVYELLGRHQDAQRVEERRTGRNRGIDKDKFVRALIYDLDEGPNGQGFAFSNEKRYNLARA